MSAALLTACGPDPEVRRACERAERWLSLDASAIERCLHEAPFRAQLGERVDEAFAAQQVRTHNRDRAILRPPPGPFTRLQHPADVPVDVYGHAPQAEQHLGNRYVVAAQLSWFPEVGGTGSSREVVLHDRDETRRGPDDHMMVGVDALNAYQQEFLSEHCYSTRPTMCTGDAYLEIRRDVRGLLVTAQLVGAEFTDADATAVLASIRADYGLPIRAPIGEKDWWERIRDFLW